jgi:2-dehydropantoate 2-reductase
MISIILYRQIHLGDEGAFMHIAIIGAGGVGAYYGARLQKSGVKVTFVARGKHLDAMQKKGLHVSHPQFEFDEKVNAIDFDTLLQKKPQDFDALILLTKATSTKEIAQQLSVWSKEHTPFIISLQNGVTNEDILASYIDARYIIAGLSVKIGAHIIAPGVIQAVGISQTIMGVWEENQEAKHFLEQFAHILIQSGIPATITKEIKLELWKKLLINNGVNALCALLEKKTGEVIHDEKLSKLVYALMQEGAIAAKKENVNISEEDVKAMFELIMNFDSIKPSMLVDRENFRKLELEEICGVVIKNCELQGVDAPYTRSVSTLLESLYHP